MLHMLQKNLWRDELYYAKYMFDNIIRFNYLQKMIEWYVSMQNNWSISTNKYGRRFKDHSTSREWKELKSTFAGADVEENWKAFFNLLQFFSKIAKSVAEKLRFEYPITTDQAIIDYCKNAKNMMKK